MAADQHLRDQLVEELRAQGFLNNSLVAEAVASVPRHIFLPGQPIAEVYTDRSFITKLIDGVPVSSCSQPAIVAVMLEQLQLRPGQRVLEIGAGTGYNAALLSHIVGPAGRVTTVDIDTETAQAARTHLESAGVRTAEVVCADGGYGHAASAPYDRIIATASCWQIPQPWIDQLVEGGVMVLPLRLGGVQVSPALSKEGDHLVSTRAAMCGFMPLRGAFGPGDADLPADFPHETLARWQEERRCDVGELHIRVRPTEQQSRPAPDPLRTQFRFRRGDHLYELWFEA